MTFENFIGCKVNIKSDMSVEKILFTETGGFIIEVKEKNISSIQSIFKRYNIEVFKIGITGGNRIILNNNVDVSIAAAKNKWENGLRKKL